jgi:hypothetical protein
LRREILHGHVTPAQLPEEYYRSALLQTLAQYGNVALRSHQITNLTPAARRLQQMQRPHFAGRGRGFGF